MTVFAEFVRRTKYVLTTIHGIEPVDILTTQLVPRFSDTIRRRGTLFQICY